MIFHFLFVEKGNLLTVTYGACCAWASVSYIELQENKSVLPSGPLTENEASLMVAILNAGGLAGNILFVYIAEKFGRRNPLFYLAIPQLVSFDVIKDWFVAKRSACELRNYFYGFILMSTLAVDFFSLGADT